MADISREEFTEGINRIFDKVDKMDKCLTGVQVDVGKLQTSFDDLTVPQLPTRPCQFFQDHEQDHKEAKASLKTPIIVGAILTAYLFIQEPIKTFIANILKGE